MLGPDQRSAVPCAGAEPVANREVYKVTNTLMLHPRAEVVQFRGMFALINLVIPDE